MGATFGWPDRDARTGSTDSDAVSAYLESYNRSSGLSAVEYRQTTIIYAESV